MNEVELQELKKRLAEHGYDLYGFTSFKKHDRVNFGNDEVKISMNLRGKLSELAFDTLVEACIGSKVKH